MGNRPPMRTDKFDAGVPSTAFTVWPWTTVPGSGLAGEGSVGDPPPPPQLTTDKSAANGKKTRFMRQPVCNPHAAFNMASIGHLAPPADYQPARHVTFLKATWTILASRQG